ncbi:MAG: FAD-binding oxidoreductase [Desulfobacterales bacterium]|jgi:glycine/D-amino acid oxidase-like deaminating enzyme
MSKKSFDIIIIGGGIMGSATAYYLISADPALKIAVVERDPTYERASTTLSMANVRTQFSLKENVQISQYTIRILKSFEEDMVVNGEQPKIYFRQEGNLFLVAAEDEKAARRALHMQTQLGCQVEWWSNQQIKEHYPLYEPRPFVGGTFGPDDGYFDAYAVLMAYKAKARSLGVNYLKDEVVTINTSKEQVAGVQLAGQGSLASARVVNCAGAWAADVARTAGVHLPVVPVRRQVFVLDTAVKSEKPLPLTILPSGLYFRSETGGLILLGKSLEDDPIGISFSWDEQRFIDDLWPELAEFVPKFDTLKVVRGWAGLYAVNTLDGNAILGQWPELNGMYLANGFSGHGLQQGPAVGRYLSELILEKPVSLDLSIFAPQRILENRALSESELV